MFFHDVTKKESSFDSQSHATKLGHSYDKYDPCYVVHRR